MLRIRETSDILKCSRCRTDKCYKVKLYDQIEPRFWRHLSVFNCECLIECSLPRLQCTLCDKVWRVKAPWEGKCKGLSEEFEAFALTLMKEMPVKSTGRILNENDKLLWRVLNAYVEQVHEAEEQARFERVDHDYLWTVKAYQMRLTLRKIYNTIPYQSCAQRRLQSWCNWVNRVCDKAPYWIIKPMRKATEMMQNHMEGILAYWNSGKLTTAYPEGLNSVFSAVKRKVRGFRNTDNLINMIYFVAAKLSL